MAIRHAKITVDDEATVISDANGDREGHTVLISNPSGGVTVYVGASNVSTTSGYPVVTGTSITVKLEKDEKLYGIVASGTQDVNVLRQGN